MDKQQIETKLATVLKNKGLVVAPTDTIYGVLALALNKDSVERVYQLKGRAPKKPFIILLSSIDQLAYFGVNLNNLQYRAVNHFWPGPVTLIFRCDKELGYLHRGEQTLAFRLPKDELLIKTIDKTGPLIAPSANPEGMEPSKNIKEAKEYFDDRIDFYLDGGVIIGSPSTIVDLTGESPLIIRGNKSILKFLS